MSAADVNPSEEMVMARNMLYPGLTIFERKSGVLLDLVVRGDRMFLVKEFPLFTKEEVSSGEFKKTFTSKMETLL